MLILQALFTWFVCMLLLVVGLGWCRLLLHGSASVSGLVFGGPSLDVLAIQVEASMWVREARRIGGRSSAPWALAPGGIPTTSVRFK